MPEGSGSREWGLQGPPSPGKGNHRGTSVSLVCWPGLQGL
jgi:hypothetical protein